MAQCNWCAARSSTATRTLQFLQPMGGDVAHASLSLVAGDPIDTQNYQPDMSSDMLISKIQNFANDHFNREQLRRRRAMRGLVTSRLLVPGKDLTLSTLVLTDPQQQKWLDYSVRSTTKRWASAQTKVNLRLTFVQPAHGFRNANSGRSMQRKYAAYQGTSSFSPFQVARPFPVVPGNITNGTH